MLISNAQKCLACQGRTLCRIFLFALLTLLLTHHVRAATFQQLRSFYGTPDVQYPFNSFADGGDDYLYAATMQGGANGAGTVFRVKKDGTGYQILFSFKLMVSGRAPHGSVLLASDGMIYGTTEGSGAGAPLSNGGLIFRINRDGSNYTILFPFNGGTEGQTPFAPPIEGSDGRLYGTCGSNNIYGIDKSGTNFSVLHRFTGTPDGSKPNARLAEGADGFLYGTTTEGGDYGSGCIFKISKNGSNYSIIHSFGAIPEDGKMGSGGAPQEGSGVIIGTDGFLYGATPVNGIYNKGIVYKCSTDGLSYTILHHFAGGGSDGANPYGQLVEASNGLIYGTTSSGGQFGTVYRIAKDGSKFGIVHSFTSGSSGSTQPQAGLIQASDGWLYGMTTGGGTASRGTMYRIGQETAPGITLIGDNPLTVEASGTYSDPGATAVDANGIAISPVLFSDTVQANRPGSYSVQWCATDPILGLTGNATRFVNVVDTTPPTITTPSGISVYATTASGAIVHFSTAATDIVSGAVATSDNPSSGAFFSIGNTTVTSTATDASGNSGNKTFTVVVTVPPISQGETNPPRLDISGSNANLTVKSSVPGRHYQLQHSIDLSVWQDVGTAQIGDGNDLSFPASYNSGLSQNFYRLKLKSPD